MTEVRVIPNCACSHADWRHAHGGVGICMAKACGCTKYRPKEKP